MKILYLTIPSGFKMLEPGFEVNFLTKTRVDKNAENEELIELEPGWYYPIETIFIGKNSSGKTTVLTLLHTVIRFLLTGRFDSSVLADQTEISVEVMFYEQGQIYKYSGVFLKGSAPDNRFLTIDRETLQRTQHRPSHPKDIRSIFFPAENLIKPNVGGDTSEVSRFVRFIMTDLISGRAEDVIMMIRSVEAAYGTGIFDKILRLFDDSIDHIRPLEQDDGKNGFLFQRINGPEFLVSIDYLKQVLSAGTYRGIFLFLSSLLAFHSGGTVIIDEIEKSVNKNLAQNLILLFNDKTINKAGATLVYSTHYAELLDDNDRVDNINVLHRVGNLISLKNLCVDYEVRVNLLKSNSFNQNAFDNLLNYDRLMDLRRAIAK